MVLRTPGTNLLKIVLAQTLLPTFLMAAVLHSLRAQACFSFLNGRRSPYPAYEHQACLREEKKNNEITVSFKFDRFDGQLRDQALGH